jgi:outer membrane PBP1 activator LpoA protein
MFATVAHPGFQTAARRLSPLLLGGVLLFSLSACTTPGEVLDKVITETKTPSQSAEALSSQGQHAAAAQAWLALAASASPELQDGYLLRASESLLLDGQLEAAASTLLKIHQREALPVRLFSARLQLAMNRPSAVLEQLAPLQNQPMETALLRQFLTLQSAAYARLGNHFEAAHQYILLDSLLSDPFEQDANQAALWAELNMLSEVALSSLYATSAPGPLRAWLELAVINKRSKTDFAQLEQWRNRHPQHPAALRFINTLRNISTATTPRPGQIALLLPLQGRYAEVATAVRDGFLAAYYADKPAEQATRLRVYDTNDENIAHVYQQAVKDGAEFVVGPLNKTSVSHLAEQATLPVPTLALNNVPDEQLNKASLYHFALLPEDEARQVAERIWLDGHSQGLMLYPDTAWGERLHTAFNEHWQQLGGKLVEVQAYPLAAPDYAKSIRALFNVDDSRQRYQNLRRVLGKKLEFDARRRQDVEFVFIAGFPEQARQIRPQLKFYDAGKLPVYATSHVYSGHIDTALDRDMDGITFGDMPWTLTGSHTEPLHSAISELWPARSEKYARLHAFGLDAYRIITHLQRLQQYPFERFSGQTGSLRMDEQQHLRRQLTWAKFRYGKPRLVEEAPVRPQQTPATPVIPPDDPAPPAAIPLTPLPGSRQN